MSYHLPASPASACGADGVWGMQKAAISIAMGLVAGALLAVAYVFAPQLGLAVSPQALMASAAAVALACTVSALTYSAIAKKPEKFSLGEIKNSKLTDIPELIVRFPDKDAGKELFIRPETYAKELDPVNNPGKYENKTLVLKLRGTRGDRDPFNPVKLREIFAKLAPRDNFQHVLLFDEDKDFTGYIPAWYARSAFVASDAEARIARAVTDIYNGSINQLDLRAIRGAKDTDTIAEGSKLRDVMPKLEGGVSIVMVMGGRKNREPIGYISSESVLKALNKAGAFNH